MGIMYVNFLRERLSDMLGHESGHSVPLQPHSRPLETRSSHHVLISSCTNLTTASASSSAFSFFPFCSVLSAPSNQISFSSLVSASRSSQDRIFKSTISPGTIAVTKECRANQRLSGILLLQKIVQMVSIAGVAVAFDVFHGRDQCVDIFVDASMMGCHFCGSDFGKKRQEV